ncbi:Putative alpha-L-rhamnosidase, concanavalin-like domain, six-hairpin glycosidase superfamily [Colletotrichum destructivum]|uniref:alpha-L-rhamnosidase n=1 Tax=Colletotrichum destructivum TaxID=34406 RepID=A0AAX4I7C8_9PEZI|nr:Putative alpha-L-rhamnosidase, concanavalin-like domain, six-hairpin glycosidase superfamily [Colletotrichum destructivum]
MPSLHVSSLRFEHHPTGLGVSSPTPRLSWHVTSDSIPKNWQQTSYLLEITRGSNQPQTFQVDGSSTTLVPWPDSPLVSAETASVRVKSNGSSDDGQLDTEWSNPATVEAGLFSQGEWTATPITAPPRSASHADERGIRPVRFRRTFDAPETAGKGRVRLYITALGIYEAYLNGNRIGDECLAPGWTAYQHRIQYQVFDVASLLKPGQTNVLSVEVSEGWYAGRVLWGEGLTCFYGDRIGVLAQLDILSDDTTSVPAFRLTTDGSWECHASPIVASGIYDGETYDLGLEVTDWHHDNTTRWSAVETLPFPKSSLVASSCPPVRITETVKPVQISTDAAGKTLVDFGQNLVGKLVVHSLQKPDGHRLTIRHAEVLENGVLGVRPLRAAKATDTVIFGGGGLRLRDWSPHFTYHGFRYVELDGWAADEVTRDSLSAVVMHTDMARTGFFSCSDDAVNALHRNVVWSMRGNFVSIPTDCPQRDERLGWTGDIQVFSPTASFLYDCAGMLGNWMRDVVLDQRDAGGVVPLVVPNVMRDGPWPSVPQAVWDDVVVLVPWTLYKWFGDAGVLRETYPGMRDYLRSVQRSEDGLWDPDLWQLGDWLDPNAPPAEPGLARTDGTLVADAYLVYVTDVVSRIAGVLGLAADAEDLAAEHVRLKQLFRDKYMTKAGFVVADSQTALALALLFDLHETPAQRTAAAARLARLVRYAKFRVSTGFAGTPVVLHALSETGHAQVAYRMLLETGCPSWLYPVVRMGATTVWERWDSMMEDGTVNPGEMTSFNHYALGSVANWMHAGIAGLAPLEAGWKKFRVRPRPGGGLKHAEAEFRSPNGTVKSRWEVRAGDRFVVEVTVPLNAAAVVSMPDESEETVGSGTYTFEGGLGSEVKEWPPEALLTQFGL